MVELPEAIDIQRQVSAALAEDVGSGDLTAALIDASARARGHLIAREAGVLCGAPWVESVFAALDNSLVVDWLIEEGGEFQAGTELATLHGPARAMLTGERCALNFLQTLSATATVTRRLVKQVAHTGVQLLDTRKTLPGLRSAQKYAVRVGGGRNHRMGLFDAFLIKENHIRACGSIRAAVARARQLGPTRPVEVEVETLTELDEALQAAVDRVLLDNFDLATIREAVARTAGRCELEASGSIDEQTLVSTAETGVDLISIGALTKHCRAIDFSLLID